MKRITQKQLLIEELLDQYQAIEREKQTYADLLKQTSIDLDISQLTLRHLVKDLLNPPELDATSTADLIEELDL